MRWHGSLAWLPTNPADASGTPCDDCTSGRGSAGLPLLGGHPRDDRSSAAETYIGPPATDVDVSLPNAARRH